MLPQGPWWAWVVAGCVFGSLFLVCCLVSVIKAIRDRHRIKSKQKARRAMLANGQGPAPGDSCAGCRRKLRTNLVLVRDTEKEERVKNGPHHGSRAAPVTITAFIPTPSPPDDDAAVSSSTSMSPDPLDDVVRARDVSAEVAGVSGQLGGISCISGGAVTDDVRADRDCRVMTRDDAALRGARRGRLRSLEEVRFDIKKEVIAFRRKSVAVCSSSSSINGLISGFPIPLTSVVDNVPLGDHNKGDATTSLTTTTTTHNKARRRSIQKQKEGEGEGAKVKVKGAFDPRRTDLMDSLTLPPLRATGSWAAPGSSSHPASELAPNPHPHNHHHHHYCTTCERHLEAAAAGAGPRRYSYAAGLATIAGDLQPPLELRRHSDGSRSVIGSSLSRLAVRGRRFKWDPGADNPAYDELEDGGCL